MGILREEIGDEDFLRYITRFSKAETMINGQRTESDKNIPQGGNVAKDV